MLIHPWDAATDASEWRDWILAGHDFGQLVANGLPGDPPMVVPTHFVLDGNALLIHLARPNPVWSAIEANTAVVMSVVDDYAYIPTTWRARAGGPDENGVPTSYYAAVQFLCTAQLIDDPDQKAELLRRQLAYFQPAGDHAQVGATIAPYGRMLPGIRGLRLTIESVRAKFKYDDHNPEEHRARTAERLEGRHRGRDVAAATQQRRRLNRIRTWKSSP